MRPTYVVLAILSANGPCCSLYVIIYSDICTASCSENKMEWIGVRKFIEKDLN